MVLADHFMESDSFEGIDFDEFSDGPSHTYTKAWSPSMISEINSVGEGRGSIHAENRSFIMDRFIPAAKAMAASESLAQRAPLLRTPAMERRTGSPLAGPLPLQSKPYFIPKRHSAPLDTDDDEHDDRLPFKVACGSSFTSRLKNAFAHAVHPPISLSARKKNSDRRGLYADDGSEDSFSGMDTSDERAIVAAATKKAWEDRYRKSSNMLTTNTLSTVAQSNDSRDSSFRLMDGTSYNGESRSQSPTTKIDRELSSSHRKNRLRTPYFNPQDKGFLGFPSDRRLNYSRYKAEDARLSNVNSFTDTNEVEEDDWYSRSSSTWPEISENFDSVTIEKGSHRDYNVVAEDNGGPLVVSMLPPPLPKSPTDSWLRRAMPLVVASNSMNHRH